MKLHILGYIRDSLISAESYEKRRNTLSTIKAAQAGFSALGLVSLGMGLLDFYEGRLRSLFLLPLAYASGIECKTIADNVREILENPAKELKAACAKLHSDEKLLEMLTHGAPLAQKAGLAYLNYFKPEPKPEPSFFSRFWSKK